MRIPQEKYKDCHLYFDIRNCHTNKTSSKDKKTSFSFAFFPLTVENERTHNHTIQSDKEHVRNIYKPPTKTDDPVFYLKGTLQKFQIWKF